jgi:hypothetical protein
MPRAAKKVGAATVQKEPVEKRYIAIIKTVEDAFLIYDHLPSLDELRDFVGQWTAAHSDEIDDIIASEEFSVHELGRRLVVKLRTELDWGWE